MELDFLKRLQLTTELEELTNAILDGGLNFVDRLAKAQRLEEVVNLLTGESAEPEKKTLLNLVKKSHSLEIRLKEPYEFEKSVGDYVTSGIEDNKKRTEFLHALTAKPKGSHATYLRDQLSIDLEGGVFVQSFQGGMLIKPYLQPDSIMWPFIEWLYTRKRLLIGDDAHTQPEAGGEGDLFNTPEANQDFENEPESAAITLPEDPAGLFYQSIIEGAEVDLALVQQALTYAEADPQHTLLPEAAQVVKEKVIEMATAA